MRPNEHVHWYTRRWDTAQEYQIVNAEGESIWISLMPGSKKPGLKFCLTRADARLLAKRLKACLDATRKK